MHIKGGNMAVPMQPVIEKLNYNNYLGWSRDMKFLLDEKNLYELVLGTEAAPDVSKTELSAQYKQRCKQAMSCLVFNISSELKGLIAECSSPSEAWRILKSNVVPDGRCQHLVAFNNFLECNIGSGETIRSYTNRLISCVDELSKMGKALDDLYVCYQLLRKMPERFQFSIQCMLQLPDESFNFKNLVNLLLAEESRQSLRESELAPARGPVIQETRRTNRQQVPTPVFTPRSSIKRDFVCFRCNRPGHLAKNCFAKLPANSKSVNNPKSKGKFVPKCGARPHASLSNTFSSNAFIIESSCKVNSITRVDEWAFDTAASHHFCKDKNLFSELKFNVKDQLSVAVDGITFPIEGIGNVQMYFNNVIYTLYDVMYSPKLRRNLMSGPRVDEKGGHFIGKGGKIKVFGGRGEYVFSAKLKNGLYVFYPNIKISKNVNFPTSYVPRNNSITNPQAFNTSSLETWHSKFGHIGHNLVLETSKHNSVIGLPKLRNLNSNTSCEPCQLGKQKRVSFKPLSGDKTHHPLEKVYMDVWGPISIRGKQGERYFLSIIDDFSRKIAIYPIEEKTQVFEIFKRHIIRAERLSGYKLKTIRTDNGTEFKNLSFDSYCIENGIKHEFTNQYTPEQNGVPERANQTILNCVRAILMDSGLPPSFWSEAVIYFGYTWNRVCHKGQCKTPYELFHKKKPVVKHLKAFGSTVFVGVPKAKRNTKLDARAKRGYLVGYALKTHGYRIWLPDEDKIIETINLKFDPESTLYRSRAVLGPDSTNNSESADNYYFLVENLPICSNLNSNDKSDVNVNEPLFFNARSG